MVTTQAPALNFLAIAGTRDFVNDDFSDERLREMTGRFLDLYQAEGNGANTFLNSMLAARRRYNGLTFGQYRAVANIALAAERHDHELDPAHLDDEGETRAAIMVLADVQVSPGYYTVGEHGKHTTIRLTKIRPDNRRGHLAAEGVLTAGVLSGHDNENAYTPFALVWPDGRTRTIRFATPQRAKDALLAVLKMTALERDAAGREYARVSGRCHRCGRLLTDPVSIDSAIGPDCAGGVAEQRRIIAELRAAAA
jgi:hypothetical protein